MNGSERTPLRRAIKWLDNFWYHQKWIVIIVAFFAVTITICTVQMVTKVDDDVCILYAGPCEFSPNQTREIQSAFRSVMEDYNGDGEKQVEFVNLLLMTDEQLEEAIAAAQADGNVLLYNQQTINENKNKYTTQIFAGQTSICLLDPNWYGNVRDSGGFAKLSDVLGYTPENAVDEYAVRLVDTPFAQAFSALTLYPEDTLLCLRLKSTVTIFKSEKKQDAWYESQCKMFRSIMGFTLPESGTLQEREEETSIEAEA